jgi:hypothetical protein
MVAQMKQDPKNIYLEIEGHYRQRRRQGHQRAGRSGARRRREGNLRAACQIPLHKMNVISYGKRQAGRAQQDQGRPRQNRRVVIKVLA